MKTITLKYNKMAISNRNTLNLASVLIIGLFYFVGTMPVYAQNVGINTTGALPKSSAILDLSTGNNTTVNSGNMGFLPPKVALDSTTSANPITNPSNGLLVYDTVSSVTGKGAHNVTPGFYYWNGLVAPHGWVRVLDIPYGNNIQNAVGATNISTNSTTFTAMAPDMSISFIPVHPVVFLTFTASGITDLAQPVVSTVSFEVLINGALPTATTPGTPGVLSGEGYGCTSLSQWVDTHNSPTLRKISGWSCTMLLPINVTPGTPVTISIDWEVGVTAGTAGLVECNPTPTATATGFRSMFIND